jgi:predicted Holliday junction resolvase-like endonuclease
MKIFRRVMIVLPEIIIAALLFLLILVLVILLYERRIGKLRENIERERARAQDIGKSIANDLFRQWSETALKDMARQMDQAVRKDYEAKLESWKLEVEDKIRKDAIQRSLRTLTGKVSEEFSPMILSRLMNADMRDFRHLGSPVDFIVFRGLSSGEEDIDVVFLEIKSGSGNSLAERERRVRNAIDGKKVSYQVVNLTDILGNSNRN